MELKRSGSCLQSTTVSHVEQDPFPSLVDAERLALLVHMLDHQAGHFMGTVGKPPLAEAFILQITEQVFFKACLSGNWKGMTEYGKYP